MNKTPIIQICFSLKTGLTTKDIKTKLTELKNKLNDIYGENAYECRSCHLSHTLCEQKGFSTEVPDMFDEIFGHQYVCELESETDFDTAMSKINDYRTQLAQKADKLVILSGETVTNVALELELFTKHRIMVL